jgi:hypothetical protein
MEFLIVGVLCGVAMMAFIDWGTPTTPRNTTFTLLELVIVVVIVAAVAGFGIPTMMRATGLSGITRPSGADVSQWQGFAIGAAYFGMMVLGMLGEYMFRLKKWSSFKLEEFVRPFWVALIVFGVPWATVDKSTITLSSVIACYQNGFFWKMVLEKQRPK